MNLGLRLTVATLSAAMALTSTVVSSTPAGADETDGPAIFRPDDPRLTYEGHWAVTEQHAITVNSGSQLTFRFTGSSLSAAFDTASITVPSQLYVTIDSSAPQLVKVGEPSIELATGLGAGIHTAHFAVKDVDEYENRWILPLQSGVVLDGIRLDHGAELLPLRDPQAHRLEFYGDSITEGVMAQCPVLGVDCADGTKDYAYLVGEAFDANTNQVGFGKQGIIQPGHGNVGTASESFGWLLSGFPAEPFHPDAVVVNFGTNDAPWSGQEFRPRYLSYLRQVRAANPHAHIFALRPFNGTHAADVAAAVDELNDPATTYVDTTGWLTAGTQDYNGGAHPSVEGHRKVADQLVRVLEDALGWNASSL